jgi:hypothetical protein
MLQIRLGADYLAKVALWAVERRARRTELVPDNLDGTLRESLALTE